MSQQIIVTIPAIKLIGIKAPHKTNNATLFQADPSTNIVAVTVQKYFHNALFNSITNRAKPGVTYCVYTEYNSDHNGDYAYFIGEEVASHDNVPDNLETLVIPSQTYIKFTTSPGPMPSVCVDLWQKIWKMTPEELGGKRSYIADFEIYDERASDHSNAVLDICIGIK